jgi:hypothetical protein
VHNSVVGVHWFPFTTWNYVIVLNLMIWHSSYCFQAIVSYWGEALREIGYPWRYLSIYLSMKIWIFFPRYSETSNLARVMRAFFTLLLKKWLSCSTCFSIRFDSRALQTCKNSIIVVFSIFQNIVMDFFFRK